MWTFISVCLWACKGTCVISHELTITHTHTHTHVETCLCFTKKNKQIHMNMQHSVRLSWKLRKTWVWINWMMSWWTWRPVLVTFQLVQLTDSSRWRKHVTAEFHWLMHRGRFDLWSDRRCRVSVFTVIFHEPHCDSAAPSITSKHRREGAELAGSVLYLNTVQRGVITTPANRNKYKKTATYIQHKHQGKN